VADVNRYWQDFSEQSETEATNRILVRVQGGTTVEMGDFIFFDDTDGLRLNGTSTKTNTGFPVSYLRPSATLETNKGYIEGRFLGVAMEGRDGQSNGVTVNLSVATKGIFKYPLRPARNVFPGYYAGPSGTTTGSDISSQAVQIATTAAHSYGYFAERKVHALEALVYIKTMLGDGMLS